jgi:hypothetical protein
VDTRALLTVPSCAPEEPLTTIDDLWPPRTFTAQDRDRFGSQRLRERTRHEKVVGSIPTGGSTQTPRSDGSSSPGGFVICRRRASSTLDLCRAGLGLAAIEEWGRFVVQAVPVPLQAAVAVQQWRMANRCCSAAPHRQSWSLHSMAAGSVTMSLLAQVSTSSTPTSRARQSPMRTSVVTGLNSGSISSNLWLSPETFGSSIHAPGATLAYR